MERIAPLAKILAEANGIDWQTLRGSGEGGMVVEQDILNYLSRIMTGEEEPPATPVDLPPPDWNGADMLPDASMLSDEQLRSAGVESDIAAFLEQARPAAAVAASSEPDEFELDDDLDDVPAAESAAPASLGGWDWSTPAAAPVMEAPVAEPVAAAPVLTAPVMEMPAPQAPAAPAPVAAAGAVTAAGLGSLLSRLYQQPAAPVTPAPAPEPVPAPAVTPADAFQWSAPQPTAETLEPEPFKAEPEVAQPEPIQHELAQPEQAEPEVVQPEPVSAAPEVHADHADEAPAGNMPFQEAHAEVQAEPMHAGAVADEIHSEPEAAEVVAVAEEPAAEPQAAESHPEVAAHAEPEAAPVAAVAAPVAPAASVTPGAVWFGTYLRRDVELGGLQDLHGQLVAALGREVPMGLLVARAAQRHAAALNVGGVALQGDSGARSVGEGHLRGSLDALDHAFDATPGLLVVDAGAHDLDDLHYPHTLTLSLGRVQGGRAALSLQGEVDPARGAQFLADVAGTLGSPILLVL